MFRGSRYLLWILIFNSLLKNLDHIHKIFESVFKLDVFRFYLLQYIGLTIKYYILTKHLANLFVYVLNSVVGYFILVVILSMSRIYNTN